MNKPRILICTCCNSEERKKQMLNIIESHKKYADKFDGIDSVFEIRQTDKEHKPTWEKTRLLLDHWDDGYDYLMWVDDDAGFIRFDKDFRDHFPSDGKRFYFTQSRKWYEGTLGNSNVTVYDNFLNAGVFFVKVCEENKKIMDVWYEKRLTHTGVFNDQPEIVKWYLKNKEICGLVDSKIFNAYPVSPDNLGTCISVKTKDSIIIHFIGKMKKLKDEYFPSKDNETKKDTKRKKITFVDDWED